MQAKDFNFEQFGYFLEEKQKLLKKLMNNEYRGPVLTQRVCGDTFGVASQTKEKSLADQLDCMNVKMQLHSDVAFGYLEPWCGVGVYANAFGAPLFRYAHCDVQTKSRYHDVEEVANVPMPRAGECELMQEALEFIRYFREETHDLIPISLTDTQSPLDSASLILDPCELFAASLEEPEAVEDFMSKVTQSVIDFSEMQIEAIGENVYTAPGHMMLSDNSFSGIALSDDNMAVVSPTSYAAIGKPYNEILSRHFGGLALHSCGVITHNVPLLLETEGLKQLDFKITDFEPNDAAYLAEKFANTDILIKPCVYPNEDLNRLLPLLRTDVKLLIHVFTSGDVDQCNRQYDQVAQFVHDHYRTV